MGILSSKRGNAAALAAAVLAATCGSALAYHDGPPDGRAGDPPLNETCNDAGCHATYPLNSGDGSLTVQGLPAGYAPGRSYRVTIVLIDPGQTRWGFEATPVAQATGLQGGTMTPVDPNYVQVSVGPGAQKDYAKQTANGSFPGRPHTTSWSIDWTAPASGTGPVRFYVAGNGANNNNFASGDYIYTSSALVNELSAAGVEPWTAGEGAPALYAYPNPMDERTTIRIDRTGAAPVELRVIDPAGREVRSFLVQGGGSRQTVPWDGRDAGGRLVPAGTYRCVLAAGGDAGSIPLIVVR